MWSALHLDDGTHIDAVGIPQMPGFGVGYVQRAGEISEIESVRATESLTVDGLVTAARIELGPPELQIEVEPVAFGALRLEAPDGRVSLFPRAMCRVRCVGRPVRNGLGRVESGAGPERQTARAPERQSARALERADAAGDARDAGADDHPEQ